MQALATDLPQSTPKTAKGERTRAAILEVALRLFRDRGYEATTMRRIAREAGVALGNAYYYFGSKERLIQAFYARTHEEHLAACRELLTRRRSFRGRLEVVMQTKLDTIAPYHRFAGVLFRTAADPRSPLNPFSEESRPVRRQATRFFEVAVEGAEAALPRELRRRLPALLWLYEMGILLFWIHDDSPGCARSYRLMERTVELITALVRLAAHPLMRPVLVKVLRLLDELDAPRLAGLAPTSEETRG